MDIVDAIRTYHDDLTSIRRSIHAHPEIGFEEHRTSDLVAGKLAEWGIAVHRAVGGTGVVGVLSRGNSADSIGLRADMDALPITEATGLAYASINPGVMHACGHDGHTTMLLGAARYLAATGNFNGTVNFIFQPAEEGLGGANAMISAGLFDRFPCQQVFGMHNRPGLEVGAFAIKPGPMMAGGAFFDIIITGRGAHGARPEDSVDPVLAAAAITSALQSIVSRNVTPGDPAVLSVTGLQAGTAYNVIPETATIRGTVRSFKRETMQMMEDNMKRLASQIAAGFGAIATVDFRFLFAPLVNDPAATDAIVEAAASLVDAAKIDRASAPVMGSEDFSFMLESRPGAYINLGNGEASAPVHNDRYDFNDAAIPFGAGLYAALVERQLPRRAAG
ncbi:MULTISPECIES: M20 aminoacylase family protein [Acidiphilium]|uniref:Hippurate hydrolase n=1 Tax=Acidiphilium rubrum TaxID=526 RepID=A0A8G2FI44_ACIRU|nr:MULTISPECIES: M20 aminoacylase family protein [Acidiphilium]MBW4035827.1 amidohydrolase [Pseudomonadota bacterium]SIR48445.1 hippurate hydrolase [Acidiphilium rubrum]